MKTTYSLITAFTTAALLLSAPALGAPDGKRAAKPKRVKASTVKASLKEAAACPMLHPARCPALKELVELGHGAAPALMSQLARKDSKTRTAAIQALGHMRYTDAGKRILLLTSDKDRMVKLAAISAVGRLKPKGAVEALARLLGGEDINQKLITAIALAETGSAGAVQPLLGLLSHYHPKVKAAACRALGSLKDPRATLSIATLIADPVTKLPARMAAVRALGALGDSNGAPILLLAAGDPEVNVRKAAIESLAMLGDARAVPALSLLLKDEAVTFEVTGALGSIGDSAGLGALLRVATEGRADERIMEKTFWALGELKAASTVKALLPFLASEDPKVLVWTLDALGRLQDESSVRSLIDALEHQEIAVKEMAAWALQEIAGVNLGTDQKKWDEWFYDNPANNP